MLISSYISTYQTYLCDEWPNLNLLNSFPNASALHQGTTGIPGKQELLFEMELIEWI